MILGRSKPKAADTPAQAKAPEKAQAAPAPQAGPVAGQTPDAAAAAAAAKQQIRPRDARQQRLGQTFAQVVAVLMRDPNFKKLALSDLEWLVLPPLMAGQFRLAHLQAPQPGNGKPGEKQESGMLVPVGVALWARVSPALDKKLSENLDEAVRLQPNEWASGDKIWLMVAAGDPRAVPTFVQQLEKTEFKGQQVKLRRRGPDGKVMVATLGQGA